MMKKLLIGIIALFAWAASFPVSAEMRWGVIAGGDITNLGWNQKSFRTTPFQVDKSGGYFAGIIGEYEIPGIGFGIDLGLQYAQRGATMHLGDFKVWQSDGFGTERAYLHYLDIPIHLRFKYSNLNGIERKIAPFVFAGPSVGILLAHSNPANGLQAYDYNNVELGLEVGLGAELWRNFQLSGSYNWGVTKALQTIKLENLHAKNRTWKIALTYFF